MIFNDNFPDLSIRYIGIWHVQNDEHVLHFVINGHLISTQPSPQQEQEINKSGLAAMYVCTESRKIPHSSDLTFLCAAQHFFNKHSLQLVPFLYHMLGFTFVYPIICLTRGLTSWTTAGLLLIELTFV